MTSVTSLSVLLTLFRALCGVLRASIIAHATGPEGLGITGSFGQWTLVLGSLATFSLSVGLIHEIGQSGDEAKRRTVLSTAFAFLLILFLAVLTAMWFFSTQIEPWVFGERWSATNRVVVSCGLLGVVLSNGFLEGVLYAFGQARSYLKGMMLYSLIELGMLAILIPNLGAWGIVWVYALSSFVLLLLFARSAFKIDEFKTWLRSRGTWSTIVARRMLFDGLGVVVQGTTFLVVNVWVRGFIVNHWGLATNGLTQVVITADAYLAALMGGVIWNRFHPEANADPDRIASLHRTTLKIFALLSVGIGTIAILISPQIIPIVYAIPSGAVMPALAIIPVGAFFSAVALSNGVVALVRRRPGSFLGSALAYPIMFSAAFLLLTGAFTVDALRAWAIAEVFGALAWLIVSAWGAIRIGDLRFKDFAVFELSSIFALAPLAVGYSMNSAMPLRRAILFAVPAVLTFCVLWLRGERKRRADGRLNLVYFSYDGILEPLGYSQVFEYLKRLSKEHSVHTTLISFEKAKDLDDRARLREIQSQCAAVDINWIPLRYHKNPPVLSTLWDLSVGFVRLILLVLSKRPDVLHARSTTAALPVAFAALVTKTPWVFDLRGFWALERVESGIWKRKGVLYYLTRALEIAFYHHAAALIVLTENGKKALTQRFSRLPSIYVISTCTAVERFQVIGENEPITRSGRIVVGYLGTTGNWYDFEATTRFFERLSKTQNAEIRIRTRDIVPERVKILANVSVSPILPENVPAEIAQWSFSVFFIRPTEAKRASQPTRLAEFLASGIPVLTNRGYGDVTEIVEHHRVGVLTDYPVSDEEIDRAIVAMNELLADRELKARCRHLAEEQYSLQVATESLLLVYESISKNRS